MPGTWIAGLVALGTLLPTALADDAFDPELHLGPNPVLYLHVEDARELEAELGRSFPWLVWGNARVQRAFAGLSSALDDALDGREFGLAAWFGFDPRELFVDFGGEVVLAFHGYGLTGPDVTLALELAGDVDSAARHFVERLAEATGQTLGTDATSDGLPLRTLLGPLGTIDVAVFGHHLVLATNRLQIQGMGQRLTGTSRLPALGGSRVHAELGARLAGASTQVRLELDLATLRQLLLVSVMNTPDAAETLERLALSGVDSLETFGVSLGLHDGVPDAVLRLGIDPKDGGVIHALRRSLPVAGPADDALARVPRDARQVGVLCFDPEPLRGLLADPRFGEAAAEFEQELGLGELTAVLAPLGPLEVWDFSVAPPVGGLGLDTCRLVRTRAVAPYRKLLLERAARHPMRVETFPVEGVSLHTVALAEGVAGSAPWLRSMLSADARGLPDEIAAELVDTSLESLLVGLAWADLDDDWTVVSGMPQAVERYLAYYRHRTDGAPSPVIARAHADLPGCSVGSVHESGGFVLAAYNTLLSASSQYAALLAQLGIETAYLPPAEVFGNAVGLGTARLTTDETGFTLRVHRGFASASALTAATLGLGVVLVGPQVFNRLQEARVTTAKGQMATIIKPALEDFRRHHNGYPDALEQLLIPAAKNFHQAYLSESQILDPWGRPYVYERYAQHKFTLRSLGADGVEGGRGEDADVPFSSLGW